VGPKGEANALRVSILETLQSPFADLVVNATRQRRQMVPLSYRDETLAGEGGHCVE